MQKLKKLFCVLLTCMLMVGYLAVDAGAVSLLEIESDAGIARASGWFSTDISANSRFDADSSFPLDKGDIVTIKANYVTKTASVDFGLIAPNGLFYYQNTKNGSVSVSIKIDEPGNYTLAIRNNSSKTISVSGQVDY